jgi:CPA2 family monovalent cation:H+ antiporter-2
MDLVGDLVVAAATALVGGLIAHRLGQPALVGYLLGGVLIGPHGLGIVSAESPLDAFADIGVALLLFAIGVEFDLRALAAVRRVAVLGGVLQIGLTAGLVLAAALAFGVAVQTALFVGFLFALSSTMAALKILEERGEADAIHGRVATGILIVQDLSVVPLAVVLPILAESTDRLAFSLAVAAIKGAAILIITYALAARVVPWALVQVAATRSNELFVLTVVALALGTALATQAVGLSIALGAFLAGMVVARSDVSHRVLAETLPLRDVFAAIFFVSIGTFIDPMFVLQWAGTIVALSVGLVLLKFVVTTGIVGRFGFDPTASVATGLVLAQVGEFSLVLGQLGSEARLIEPVHYGLLLALTLTTIMVNAPIVRGAQTIGRWLETAPVLRRWFGDPLGVPSGDPPRGQHVVICGFGRVGREVADALVGRGFRYLVVELNPHIVADLRRQEVPCLYGDASREEVLRRAGIDRARGLACTVPERRATEAIVRAARALAPRLDIIARARDAEHVADLQAAGATEVVYPEFEAGLEFIRHLFHRYGVSFLEIEGLVQGRRTSQYRRPEEGL